MFLKGNIQMFVPKGLKRISPNEGQNEMAQSGIKKKSKY